MLTSLKIETNKIIFFTGLVALMISAALLIVAYLYTHVPEKWLSSVAPQIIAGSSFSLVRGTGQTTAEALTVHQTGEDGVAIAAYQTYGIRAEDFPVVELNMASVSPPPEAFVLWRTAENPGATFTRPLRWRGAHPASLAMSDEPDWRGEITGLALVVRGKLSAPLILYNVKLRPVNARTALADLISDWTSREVWHGGSINFIYGGRAEANMAIVPAAALWSLLAIGIYVAWHKWRKRSLNLNLITALILIAWLVVDLRWQANLLSNLQETYARYAGKTWIEKHRAAEDGDLFDFIQAVKIKLGASPARVFMFSDFDYLRGRGAYHLYPQNVYYLIKDSTLPPLGTLRKGDNLVFYQKRGVTYHPERKELLWNGQALPVELILFSKGNAYFKVR